MLDVVKARDDVGPVFGQAGGFVHVAQGEGHQVLAQ
jgi:hypothetical protein